MRPDLNPPRSAPRAPRHTTPRQAHPLPRSRAPLGRLAAAALTLSLGLTACATGPATSPNIEAVERRLASPPVATALAAHPGYLDNVKLYLDMAQQAHAAQQPVASAAYAQQAQQLIDGLLRQEADAHRADPQAAQRVAVARANEARSAVSAARTGLEGLQVLLRGAPEDAARDAQVEAARQSTGRAEVALVDGEPDVAIAEAGAALQAIERLRGGLTVQRPEADPATALHAALAQVPGAQADLAPEGLSVRLEGIFEPQSAAPSEAGRQALAELGEVASRFAGWQIEVATQAQLKDADPTAQLVLAQRRAAAVRAALESQGVSQGRMTGQGRFGEGDPTAVRLVFRPFTAARASDQSAAR